MPVKKRNPKARAQRITDAAIAAFKTAEARSAQRLACIRGDCAEPDRDLGVHCARCREHIDATLRLRRELHIRPFEASPVGPSCCFDERTDDELLGSANFWDASIPRARELRRELLQAAGLSDDDGGRSDD